MSVRIICKANVKSCVWNLCGFAHVFVLATAISNELPPNDYFSLHKSVEQSCWHNLIVCDFYELIVTFVLADYHLFVIHSIQIVLSVYLLVKIWSHFNFSAVYVCFFLRSIAIAINEWEFENNVDLIERPASAAQL